MVLIDKPMGPRVLDAGGVRGVPPHGLGILLPCAEEDHRIALLDEARSIDLGVRIVRQQEVSFLLGRQVHVFGENECALLRPPPALRRVELFPRCLDGDHGFPVADPPVEDLKLR